MPDDLTPLIRTKAYGDPSVFQPANLLREARRQKSLDDQPVPTVCVLDPDGDLVRHARADGSAQRNPHWPGYHTTLYDVSIGEQTVGVIGCAVGSSFAVLVAEQLFAAGCRLLISVTSSGQIVEKGDPPYLVLIEKAWRDEGTSLHYLPPSDYVHLNPTLSSALQGAFTDVPVPVYRGAAWTTDAPFRETEAAIAAAREEGILAVEMEAAALYAFAKARKQRVVCFAHVTNQMATVDGDFEKGEAEGTATARAVIAATVQAVDEGDGT
ncbi:MAG: uridine phosphorylase [Bacteroidetes bacterium]|jgi:uridine phosphorylase|nr:uridine phosphorylase [Bacteroidota bacterium]